MMMFFRCEKRRYGQKFKIIVTQVATQLLVENIEGLFEGSEEYSAKNDYQILLKVTSFQYT